jgi:PmbA protein
LKNYPRNPELPQGTFFDGFGVPTQDVDIIENGVLKNFLIDFYCSRKLDRPQSAGNVNLSLSPGNTPIADIIASIDEGILMSRFSGSGANNKLDFSGVAKNSFYIKNGEIQFPLVETMVSGNFAELIRNVRNISSETVNNGSSVFPYVHFSGATLSSQ